MGFKFNIYKNNKNQSSYNEDDITLVTYQFKSLLYNNKAKQNKLRSKKA